MKNKEGFVRKGVSWVKNKIKDTDRFALPVSLNFKGDSSFKTGIGGVVSVVIIWGLVGYSVILWIGMVNRENSVINSVTKIGNLIYDPTKYNLNDYKFIVGIYSLGLTASYISDPAFFTLEAIQRTATK